jgi:tetratricopeptide (TPR) repeat protein
LGNINRGNFSKALEITTLAPRPKYRSDIHLFTIQLYTRNYEKAFQNLKKMVEWRQKKGFELYPSVEYAYIYKLMEEKDLAVTMYEKSFKNIEEIMKIPTHNIYWSWFSLMEYYASLNEKEKALEYLRKLINAENKFFASNTIQDLKSNPIYDCIRPEPEFVSFLQTAETNFQAEQAKIENLLRKEKIIP